MTSKQNKRLLPQVEKMLSAASAQRIERAHESTRRSRSFRRGRRTLVVLLASLALTGTALATVTGWNPLAGDSPHPCNSFSAESNDRTTAYRIVVSNSTGLACKRATSVIEALWGPEQAITQHGRYVANSYYTIEGFPEWRCFEAADAGLCRLRDGLVAEYAVEHRRQRRAAPAADPPHNPAPAETGHQPREPRTWIDE